jgi:hypothetical protein
MLRSVGKARKHEERRVRIVPRFAAFSVTYYVSLTTHDVVISQQNA